MRRYRLANTPPEKRKYLRKSQLWSEDFTAKLYCSVEFWVERLPKPMEYLPEFERLVAVGGNPVAASSAMFANPEKPLRPPSLTAC
jgi:hypothetical protein